MALKSKDALRVNVIRQLQADLVKNDKDNPRHAAAPPTASLDLSVLLKSAQKWTDALTVYRQALDLVNDSGRKRSIQLAIEKEEAELNIVQQYLPSAYTEKEISQELDSVIAMAKNAGANKLLNSGHVMKQLLGRLDPVRIWDKRALLEMVQDRISTNNSSTKV